MTNINDIVPHSHIYAPISASTSLGDESQYVDYSNNRTSLPRLPLNIHEADIAKHSYRQQLTHHSKTVLISRNSQTKLTTYSRRFFPLASRKLSRILYPRRAAQIYQIKTIS
jgi:hypothetical protein